MRSVVLALSLCLSIPLIAQSGFQAHTYSAPIVQHLIAADLNRDGYPDLITYGGPVDVYLNDGHGGLLARKYVGTFAAFATVVDFDKDGLPDIATCHLNSDNATSTVAVYRNAGSGSFQLPISQTLNGICTSLSAGDVDGDGNPDLVVTSYSTDSNYNITSTAITTIFGRGTYFSPINATQSNPNVDAQVDPTNIYACHLSSAAGGDFQKAGRVDLVLIGACASGATNAGTLYYATSDKAGHYALKEITEDTRGYDYFPPYTSDVNGDGRPDVVLIDYQSGPHGSWNNNLDFLVNNGAGSFTLKQVFNENSYAASYLSAVFSGAAADFNKDGIYDAVAGFTQSPDGCCTKDTPGIAILNGTNSGTYTESQRWNVAAYPYATITTDLNNDGRPDIATIQLNSAANKAQLITYVNTMGSACSVPTSAGVHLCSPVTGSTYSSPVTVSAAAKAATGSVAHLELWIDSKKYNQYPGATMNVSVPMAAGTHRVVVVEVDTTGNHLNSSPANITVK